MAFSLIEGTASAAPSSAAILQRQLKSVERGSDTSLADMGELLAKTVRAAEEGGIHPLSSQKAINHLVASIGHEAQARGSLHLFHAQCSRILKAAPLRELGWGDTGPSPGLVGATDDAEPIMPVAIVNPAAA